MHYHQLKFAALSALSVWASAVACRDIVSASGLEARTGVNYTELATKLSKNAQIYLPDSDAFDAAVARWSNLSTPVANVVVVPSTEHDIVETVRTLSNIISRPAPLPPEYLATACLSSHGLGQLRKPVLAAISHHEWRAWINHHAG